MMSDPVQVPEAPVAKPADPVKQTPRLSPEAYADNVRRQLALARKLQKEKE